MLTQDAKCWQERGFKMNNIIAVNNMIENAMTMEQVMQRAPSVFAQEAHFERSYKYKFIPTVDLLTTLGLEGWYIVQACEQRVRNASRRGYQKHLLRLRHPQFEAAINGLLPEIVLTNSHDGTSAFHIHFGLFRLVCSNGLVIADSTFERVSVRHIGYQANDVLAASNKIIEAVPQVMGKVKNLQAVNLNDDEQRAFAKSAALLRWDEGKEPFQTEKLLYSRRHADNGSDLFTVMNRVQENMVKGKLRSRNENGERRSIRAVTGLDQGIKLNKALWQLAESMAELKQAA